jgi:Type I restriction enzyme R protein N terminus (HSDR_N)
VPINELTQSQTESDLESRIQETLKHAFPWLDSDSIRHQTKFSFTFGRTPVEIDGRTVSRYEARTDILLKHKDQPLAILELKRPESSLTPADREQGLSYARMLHPSPPLVVVTNGAETEFFETHTGKPWQPEEPPEQAVAKLFTMASEIAAADMKRAMDVLLSPPSELWVDAVRSASRSLIAEMTGSMEDSQQPFAEKFAIPRTATNEVLAAIETHRLVIVEGAPLSGKSNVLREMVSKTGDSNTRALLYLEAEPGGVGALQRLANVLSETLGWQVSRDEVRQWLRNLSLSHGLSLVVILDGLGSNRDEIYRDLDELTSGFGVKLRVVIGVDDTVAERLVVSSNGLKASAIGRKAKRIKVDPLSDDEFDGAMGVLEEHKVGILFGGKEAEEYRSPWVLRAVVASALSDNPQLPAGVFRLVPSLLGTDIISHARKIFADKVALRRRFRKIACAVLEDIVREGRDGDEILLSVLIFLVRRSTVAALLNSQDIEALLDQSLLREFIDKSGESMFVIRLPELLAAELALELANNAISQIQKNENPAEWLSKASRLLPFGDIIVAQAILDSAVRMNGVPIGILLWFLNNPPTRNPIVAGGAGRMRLPAFGTVDVEFKANGVVHLVAGGERVRIDMDEDDFGSYSDEANWLILSHIAANPLWVQSKDGVLRGRIDQELLLDVGSSPFVLRRVGSSGFSSHLVHTIQGYGEIVCHKAGIIEPITVAIYEFLSREGLQASEWVREATRRKSLPLLFRIAHVFGVLESSTDSALAEWSSATRRDLVEPALSQFPPLRCE